MPYTAPMLLTPLLCLLIAPQADELLPPHPLDRVVELELTADEPLRYEYESEFDGTLHIWTSSELDLALRIEAAGDAKLLAEDDNSGGGTTPYISHEVKPGDELVIFVSQGGEAEAESGEIALHLIAAPENDATREATLAARKVEKAADELIEQGERGRARELLEPVVSELRATDGAEYSKQVSDVLHGLGISCRNAGAIQVGLAARDWVHRQRERTLPADHSDLLAARRNLAGSMAEMGDIAGARAVFEAVLEARERSLPADHPKLLASRLNLAVLMKQMGDLAGARALEESALEAYERSLPADHPELLRARLNLASSMGQMGDLAEARVLEESVLEAYERSLPADHPKLLIVRQNLAVSMHELGDLAGARALYESVLEASERTLPADHPDLLAARQNLASSMYDMGDVAGARALYESVLEASERSLPADHPALLAARQNLAISMKQMGDLAGARALYESVLEARERTLPADHPDLLRVRQNLANSMRQMGDHAGARALYESVLVARERTLPADHPDLLGARQNLAVSMSKMRDLAGARSLEESVLAAYERTLPADHPDLLLARMNLASSMYQMGDLAGVRALLTRQCEGMKSRVLAALALAPRQARGTVGAEAYRLGGSSFFSELGESETSTAVFELMETMRLVASEAARSLASFGADPELAPILAKADELRREQGNLIGGAAQSDMNPEEVAAELTRLSLVRDRLEGEANLVLAGRGVVAQPVEAASLAEALGEREAAVGFRRLAHWSQAEEGGEILVGADHLLAHVLRSDGGLAKVDLGPAAELEELANDWRAALGAALDGTGSRGIAVEGDIQLAKPEAGIRLRERLIDPILAAAGEDVERLFVCADDLVYSLPLDALPLDDEGKQRLGDRVRIVNEVSFARLLVRQAELEGSDSLLALGGVDYDADAEIGEDYVAVAPPVASVETSAETTEGGGTRSGTAFLFPALAGTEPEAASTAELFDRAFAIEPTLLTKKETTKAALFEAAPGKRYVHLATHGWFAPESVKSTEDTGPNEDSSFARMSVEERVTGFAPMTLCGLALAGANHGADSLGRVKGILTAEELCTLDLSQCELAVLSACETNVGIRRAGQGIQSLQAALYAAGARTSITSLWKVDDAATRRLMELFYTNLWIEKLPKSEALWSAKVTMREEGFPPSTWAAWVMTGDPD